MEFCILFYSVLFFCNQINTTGATSGAGTAYPSEAPEFTPVFSGVRVTPSLVVCVICRSLFVLMFFFFFVILSFFLLRFTDSDYLFGIFKLFLEQPSPKEVFVSHIIFRKDLTKQINNFTNQCGVQESTNFMEFNMVHL